MLLGRRFVRVGFMIPAMLVCQCTDTPAVVFDQMVQTGRALGVPSGGMQTAIMAGMPGDSASPLPCDVAALISLRCAHCHSDPPLAGVPMPLVTWSDFHAPSAAAADIPVYQRVAARLRDADKPMPPTGVLGGDELAVLEQWVMADAPAGAEMCSTTDTPPAQHGPPPGSTCYSLRAHGESVPGDASPWVVSDQHYACFFFDMPWPKGAQGIYFASEFDENPQLIHHWILYLDENGDTPDGTARRCSAIHPSNPTMVAGWAAGSDNNDLPDDVGMYISPDSGKLLLEMHFFHDGASPPIATHSGIKVCTADEPRTHTATISLLGTELIAVPPNSRGTASGVCRPQYDGTIHILRSWPHMHTIGAGLTTVVRRADGTRETLGEWPFDFTLQRSYATPIDIYPGDELDTTCYYENPTSNFVIVGPNTENEMCFNFVTAYPAKALKSPSWLGDSSSFTGSATACLQ